MIVNYPRMKRRVKGWPDDLDTALEFSSANPFSISAQKKWDGKLKYTNGSGWKTWDGSTIASGEIENHHCIYLRGIGNSKITGVNSSNAKWNIIGTNIACNGDIDLLLDYSTVKSGNRPTLADRCYAYMFWDCMSLTAAPSLPATTLASSCYQYMFDGCTKIKLSTTASGTYTKPYRIPKIGTGTTALNALYDMFADTGGTFRGTPEINTTYYLDESNTIV